MTDRTPPPAASPAGGMTDRTASPAASPAGGMTDGTASPAATPAGGMTDGAPVWVSAALAVERASVRAADVVTVVVSELVWALVPPGRRDAVTQAVYGRRRTYVPGGGVFRQGLFRWEEEALGGPPFPRAGRYLVGGAGGGRELVGLAERGFAVLGFEPTALAVDAEAAVARFPGSRCVRAAYRDLVAAVQGGQGPLSGHLDGPFDGVVLGWTSLSHVLDASDRTAVLEAVRAVAPGAPVLASFYVVSAPATRRLRFRTTLGRLAGADSSIIFLPHAGFVCPLGPADVAALAASAGYQLLSFDVLTGHAVMVPATTR